MKRRWLKFLFITIMLSCQNENIVNDPIKTFVNTMCRFECKDTTNNNFILKFNFSSYDSENHSTNYDIPDSIINSSFYNAYASRFVGAFYHKVNSDTVISYKDLLSTKSNDVRSIKKKVGDYCSSDPVYSKIFNDAEMAFNKKQESKYKISLDSLIMISINYFDIAGYDERMGFIYHFVCGKLPFEYNYENSINILITEFCKEALKNKNIFNEHRKITNAIKNAINKEYNGEFEFEVVKRKYEPKLREMWKNSTVPILS